MRRDDRHVGRFFRSSCDCSVYSARKASTTTIRVARFAGMKPNKVAFLDTVLPEHRRDLFNMIGVGVNEDPDTKPAIDDARGFTLAHNGCERGKGSALHTHPTIEVFIPLTGTWSIYWGDEGEHEVILEQGDVISVPTGVMRGFKNVGDEYAVLMAIIEGSTPPGVAWHDGIIAAADAVLDRADRNSKIIPGHGPLCGIDELKAYRSMLVDIRGNVVAMMKAGKTKDEIIAAKSVDLFAVLAVLVALLATARIIGIDYIVTGRTDDRRSVGRWHILTLLLNEAH